VGKIVRTLKKEPPDDTKPVGSKDRKSARKKKSRRDGERGSDPGKELGWAPGLREMGEEGEKQGTLRGDVQLKSVVKRWWRQMEGEEAVLAIPGKCGRRETQTTHCLFFEYTASGPVGKEHHRGA